MHSPRRTPSRPRPVPLAGLHALVLAALAACGASPPPERPNFVLLMADDQGWGDLGYRGHPLLHTPNLDTMAAEGLELERFYAAAPTCSPTRGSVLTGRHPNRFGCFNWGGTLQPGELTLAQVLRQAGYATGHFGKWHLGSIRPDSPTGPAASGFERWVSSPNYFENDPWLSDGGRVEHRSGEGSLVVVDAALDFVREALRDERPFLAVLWFSAPHAPHQALPEDRARYADQPEDLGHYLGELTALDRAVGRLRAELRSLDVADHTLLWYTSDNGPDPVGSTGGLGGGKGTLQEGGIRVPCMIEWPAVVNRPRVSPMPCGTVDVYPTLLELAGVPLPPGQGLLDGRSLAGLIRGEQRERGAPLGFWVIPAEGRLVSSAQLLKDELEGRADEELPAAPARRAPDDREGLVAWIDGDYKLLGRYDASGAGVVRLFDLAADPAERHDLARDEPERTARMRAELEAWQGSVVRSLNGEVH